MNQDQRAAMERHNYYSDSRVRDSLFSSCWKIVQEGECSAIVEFDGDFLRSAVHEPKIEAAVEKWVKDEEPFTQAYRDALLERKRLQNICLEARNALHEKHGITGAFVGSYVSWQVPNEERGPLNELRRDFIDYSLHKEECRELYKRAESEMPFEKTIDEAGFKTFTIRGEPFHFCMELNTKYEVCGQCSGSGKVVNPNIDAGGLTHEDLYEDPDFAEEYFSGRYDITCPRCGGKRVESQPQFPEWLAKAIQERDESMWEGIDENLAELRMGA